MLQKIEKTPINKTQPFKMFSFNLMKQKRVTAIPWQSCFSGWEEICQRDLGRICDALHNLLSEACRRLKTGMALLRKPKQTAFF